MRLAKAESSMASEGSHIRLREGIQALRKVFSRVQPPARFSYVSQAPSHARWAPARNRSAA